MSLCVYVFFGIFINVLSFCHSDILMPDEWSNLGTRLTNQAPNYVQRS